MWDFIESYGPHIKRVVRHRLNQKMRSKFDSGDFVQMVWASFFANPRQIAQFKEPNQLIKYLVIMARNKVIDESRRCLKYQQNNVRKELSCDFKDTSLSPSDRKRIRRAPSRSLGNAGTRCCIASRSVTSELSVCVCPGPSMSRLEIS